MNRRYRYEEPYKVRAPRQMIVEGYDCPSCVDGCPPGQGKLDQGNERRPDIPHGCVHFFDPGYECNNGTCIMVNMPAKAPPPRQDGDDSGPGQAPMQLRKLASMIVLTSKVPFEFRNGNASFDFYTGIK